MTNFWKKRSVLVTGCTGLMGSWLVANLLEKGANVTGLVRDAIPASELILSGNVKRINVVQGDVADYQTVLRAFNEYDIQTCFHLAAQTIVGTAARSPLSTFDANIKGTWTVLEAARVSGTKADVVIASSDKAYGVQKHLPYDESMPLLGSFPYDASKVCSEVLARSYHATYGMRIAIARCANLFGGGDLNFNRLIPGTMLWALKGEPIIIRSDGNFKREFLYVEDAAEAYAVLGAALAEKDISGEAFNFGGGEPLVVKEMVKRILTAAKSSVPIKIENFATNEIRDQYLSSEKARSELGWTAATPLDEALAKTYAWYKCQHEAGLF